MKCELNGKIFYEDSEGRMVPEDLMKPQDIVRDDLVEDLATKYLECLENVRKVKAEMERRIDEYRNTVLLQFGIESKHTNSPSITLNSFDGKYRITITGNTVIEFNENVTAAKAKFDEYLADQLKSSEASAGLKALVESAFRIKQGQMDVKSILALTRINIPDEKFQEAVNIIKASIVTRTTNPSLRVYVKGDKGYELQELKFSTLDTRKEMLKEDKSEDD